MVLKLEKEIMNLGLTSSMRLNNDLL